MNENYYALYLAIISENQITPEQAFKWLENGNLLRKMVKPTEFEIKIMYLYRKKGLTNAQVGLLFGLDREAVSQSINRFIKKKGLQPLARCVWKDVSGKG